MKLRFHEAIGMDLPAGFGTGLGQGLHKGTPVNLVAKHRGFAIAPAHDVVNGACVLDSKFSGHEASIIDFGKAVNPNTNTKVRPRRDPLEIEVRHDGAGFGFRMFSNKVDRKTPLDPQRPSSKQTLNEMLTVARNDRAEPGR